MKDHYRPLWILGYDTIVPWPENWDRAMLVRILASPDACSFLDGWFRADQAGAAQTLLEECLGMRERWKSMSKIPAKESENFAREVSKRATELVELIESDALRAFHTPSLTVEFLFPERLFVQRADLDLGPLKISQILRRVSERLAVPTMRADESEAPDRPGHKNAYRTFVAQRLIKFFRDYACGPLYSRVADFTGLIIDDPNNFIDSSHVAKLDRDR